MIGAAAALLGVLLLVLLALNLAREQRVLSFPASSASADASSNALFNALAGDAMKTSATPSARPTNMSAPSLSASTIKAKTVKPGQRYTLCAMTRVRDTARYLVQWLEYHVLMGFEHFFIVNDCSDDGGATQAVLAFYRDLGLVALHDFPPGVANVSGCASYVPNHSKSFRLLAVEAQSRCEWLGVFDADEYVTPVQDGAEPERMFLDYLRAQGAAHGNRATVRLPWFLVGSGGREARVPHKLLLESFAGGHYDPARHIKSFCAAELLERDGGEWGHPHYPSMPKGHAYGRAIEDPWLRTEEYTMRPSTALAAAGQRCIAPRSPWFLKHFVYMSFEEFAFNRANKTLTGGGMPNHWLVNPRAKWLDGNFSRANDACFDDAGSQFTATMSARLRHSLEARRRSIPSHNGSVTDEARATLASVLDDVL